MNLSRQLMFPLLSSSSIDSSLVTEISLYFETITIQDKEPDESQPTFPQPVLNQVVQVNLTP
jgi:hypothetical protein